MLADEDDTDESFENIIKPPISKSQICRLSKKPSNDELAKSASLEQSNQATASSQSSQDASQKNIYISKAELATSKIGPRVRREDVKKLAPTEREQQRVAARQEKGIFEIEIAPKPERKGAEKLRAWVTLNKPVVKAEFPKFPPIENLKTTENKKLLLEKLKWCRISYDFHSAVPDHQTQSKKRKQEALTEIHKLVSKEQARLDKQMYDNIIIMVSINIFRNLPRVPLHTDPRGWNQEEDMAPKDPAWLHLKPVYDILFSLLNGKHFQVDLAKRLIDVRFAKALLHNLNANDIEERSKAKLCFHRIYSHFNKMRRKLLPELINLAMQHAYEGETFLGIKETLELLGTIVTGFLVPLKPENKLLLRRVVFPLFKCQNLPVFHQPLSFTTSQYAIKEPTLSIDIVHWLIINWPKCRNKREILFFKSLEEIMQIMSPIVFDQIYTWLCTHLAKCISSPNSQVSGKALEMWNSDYYAALVSMHPAQIIRIYAPYVVLTADGHWQKDSRDCAMSLIEIFSGMNDAAFQEMVRQSSDKRKRKTTHSQKVALTLKNLEDKFPPIDSSDSAPSDDLGAKKKTRKSHTEKKKKKKKNTTPVEIF